MDKHCYSEFSERIDMDAFEAAIDFDVLERKGDNDIGHCPDIWGLHKNGDSTGKFAIHREKRVYNCWVCDGGSILSLVMEKFQWDVDEATEWLRQFAQGDMRTDGEFMDYYFELLEDSDRRVATMPYFNERVLERFDGPVDWFHTRGLDDSVIASYNLRFGESVMKPAPMKETADGPAKIDDDYYGPAAIFPHYWQHRLVGWQHRWMEWDPLRHKTPRWLAKYTNTTDFPKSDTLFNLDVAAEGSDPVVVVESVPTVLLLARYDIPAVSYFGGGIKDPQLRLLRKLQQGVILAPDNDPVGKKFVDTATQYLERYIEVKCLPPVKGKAGLDLGDFVNKKYRKDNQGVYEAIRDHLDLAYAPEVI